MRHPSSDPLGLRTAAYCMVLDVSFECPICEEDTPVRDAKRAVFSGLDGGGVIDLCPACYEGGMLSGIIKPA